MRRPNRRPNYTKTEDIENYEIPPDYLVYKDGAVTVAVDGDTGIEESRDSNAVTVLQYAADQLTSGFIYAKGEAYSFNKTLTLGDDIKLEFGKGNLITVPDDCSLSHEIVDTLDIYYLIGNKDHAGGNENIHIGGANIDFQGDGKDTDKDWAGIWLHNCTHTDTVDCKVEDVVYDAYDDHNKRAYGIYYSNSNDCVIKRCIANHCGYQGIGIVGSCDNVKAIDCKADLNRMHSMQISTVSSFSVGANPSNCSFIRCSGDKTLIVHGTTESAQASGIAFINCNGRIYVLGHVKNVEIIGCNIGNKSINIQDAVYGDAYDSVTENVNIIGCTLDGSNIGIRTSGINNIIRDITISDTNIIDGQVRISDGGTGNTFKNILLDKVHQNFLNQETIDITGDGAGGTTIENIQIINSKLDTGVAIRIEGGGAGNSPSCKGFKIINTLHTKPIDQGPTCTMCHLFNDAVLDDIEIINCKPDYADGVLLVGASSTIAEAIVRDSDLTGNLFMTSGGGTYTKQVVRNNRGVLAENSGTATILNTAVSIIVTHGLRGTPTIINVTGQHTEVSDLYVDTVGAANFTIHTIGGNVTANRDIFWEAKVR